MKAIKTESLSRIFRRKGKEFFALKDVTFEVPCGIIFGLLGPNGAGKTTLIKILTTLLYPTSGKAYVAGYDVVAQAKMVKPLITLVQGGETTGYGILTVEEHLWIFSQFYGVPSKVAKRRINEYLERFGISDLAKVRMNQISTGQRQKVHLIRGLITDPKIFFLDEPTLGLDVPTSKMIRSFLKEWIASNHDRTIFLTTHNMHEANEMSELVGIIHRGRILACGEPNSLISSHIYIPRFRLKTDKEIFELGEQGLFKLLKHETDNSLHAYEVECGDEKSFFEFVWSKQKDGLKVYELSRIEPTLEELFLKITGGETG